MRVSGEGSYTDVINVRAYQLNSMLVELPLLIDWSCRSQCLMASPWISNLGKDPELYKVSWNLLAWTTGRSTTSERLKLVADGYNVERQECLTAFIL